MRGDLGEYGCFVGLFGGTWGGFGMIWWVLEGVGEIEWGDLESWEGWDELGGYGWVLV